MIAAFKGNILAFALFAAAFALHIVGGVTDQGWLFAFAVALIALVAAGFPWIAVRLGRPASVQDRRLTVGLGTVIGAVLVASVLWAANDRAWAWWHFPAAAAIALAVGGWTLQSGDVPFRRKPGSPSTG